MRSRHLGGLLVGCLLLLGACSSSSGGNADAAGAPSTTTDPNATWTVLVYQAGDNRREAALLDDLRELVNVKSDDRVTFLVLSDRSPEKGGGGYTSSGLADQDEWQGAVLLRVREDHLGVEATYGDVDLGDPATLRRFVGEQLAAHPAAHRALFVAGHGSAWQGVGVDEGSGSTLDLAGLAAGIQGGLDDAGVDRLDLLALDGSMTGSLTSLAAVAPVARYALASPEYLPNHGLNYKAFATLVDNPGLDGLGLGNALLDGFNTLSRSATTYDRSVLSLVDLDAVPELVEATDAAVGALLADPAAAGTALARAGAIIRPYGAHPDLTLDLHQVDLGQLLDEVGTLQPDLAGAFAPAREALQAAVVRREAGRTRDQAAGVSVYLPLLPDQRDPAAAEVPGLAAWNDALDTIHTALPAPGAALQGGATGAVTVTYDSESVKAVAPFDQAAAAGAASAAVVYGFPGRDGALLAIAADESPTIDTSAGTVSSTWGQRFLAIVEDGASVPVFARITPAAQDPAAIEVPFRYQRPNSTSTIDVVAHVTIDRTNNKVFATYYEVQGPYRTEVTFERGGQLTPMLLRVGADGSLSWVAGTTSVEAMQGRDGTPPALTSTPYLSGLPLVVAAMLTDAGGNRVVTFGTTGVDGGIPFATTTTTTSTTSTTLPPTTATTGPPPTAPPPATTRPPTPTTRPPTPTTRPPTPTTRPPTTLPPTTPPTTLPPSTTTTFGIEPGD